MMAKRKQRKRSMLLCATCPKARPQAGLPLTIPLGVPTYWTPEEALAVFELIDDLRDKILAVYQADLQDALRQQRQAKSTATLLIPDEDLPF
jgi:hypothetical protein